MKKRDVVVMISFMCMLYCLSGVKPHSEDESLNKEATPNAVSYNSSHSEAVTAENNYVSYAGNDLYCEKQEDTSQSFPEIAVIIPFHLFEEKEQRKNSKRSRKIRK